MAADAKTSGYEDVIKDVGLFGQKVLITLNSGAIITLLVFLGNVYGKAGKFAEIDISQIKWSMQIFFVGICFCLLSVLITYFLAQGSHTDSKWQPTGWAYVAWMVMPAFLSFIFFGVGFYSALCAVPS